MEINLPLHPVQLSGEIRSQRSRMFTLIIVMNGVTRNTPNLLWQRFCESCHEPCHIEGSLLIPTIVIVVVPGTLRNDGIWRIKINFWFGLVPRHTLVCSSSPLSVYSRNEARVYFRPPVLLYYTRGSRPFMGTLTSDPSTSHISSL